MVYGRFMQTNATSMLLSAFISGDALGVARDVNALVAEREYVAVAAALVVIELAGLRARA